MNTFSLEQVKELLKEIYSYAHRLPESLGDKIFKALNEPTPVLSAEEAVKKLEWYAWSEWGMIAYKEGVRIEDVFILRQNVLDILGASDNKASAPVVSLTASSGNSLEQDWVSVKDGLPDYDERVLWFLEDGNMVVEDLDKDGNPWLLEDWEVEGFKGPKAVYWRNLPQPPKIIHNGL